MDIALLSLLLGISAAAVDHDREHAPAGTQLLLRGEHLAAVALQGGLLGLQLRLVQAGTRLQVGDRGVATEQG